MKILITKASDCLGEGEVRVNQTAQDILNLIAEYGSSIIVSNDCEDYDYQITIYDDWME